MTGILPDNPALMPPRQPGEEPYWGPPDPQMQFLIDGAVEAAEARAARREELLAAIERDRLAQAIGDGLLEGPLAADAIAVLASRPSRRQATHAVYARHFARFREYVEPAGFVMPFHAEVVAAFLLKRCENGIPLGTIRRDASAIAYMHEAAGYRSPCRDDIVQFALHKVAREARGGKKSETEH